MRTFKIWLLTIMFFIVSGIFLIMTKLLIFGINNTDNTTTFGVIGGLSIGVITAIFRNWVKTKI